MLTERLTFRARYGTGDALVALFRERAPVLFGDPAVRGARLATDATGPMFTIAVETDFADLPSYAAYSERRRADFGTPEFGKWFERMAALTEAGDRQLFTTEVLR